MLCCACGGSKEKVEIKRFEKVLFDTPASELPAKLEAFQKDYPIPLLNAPVSDQHYMAELQGFLNDSVVRGVYTTTMERYSDLSWLEKELGEALYKARKEDDEIVMEHFATFLPTTFDYSSRIIADRERKCVLVSIDQYALPGMERYSYFGLPMYMVTLSDSAYLASDVMAAIARQFIASPNEDNLTMLDLMISEGKVLYFLDKVMPRKEDFLKIRYTPEQLKWCEKNESMIWAYFIQHDLLYEKDFSRYHNFVDDAPKTNAFKDSAPRTTDFIGWHIVRSYMENNDCSMKELFENTNAQAILQASKYKP